MDFNDIEKNVLQELMERKTEVNGAGVTSSSLNSLKRFKYADANNIVYNLAKKGLINGTFIRPNNAFESRKMQNVVGGRN